MLYSAPHDRTVLYTTHDIFWYLGTKIEKVQVNELDPVPIMDNPLEFSGTPIPSQHDDLHKRSNRCTKSCNDLLVHDSQLLERHLEELLDGGHKTWEWVGWASRRLLGARLTNPHQFNRDYPSGVEQLLEALLEARHGQRS